jgi:hypothetical protein
LPVISTATGEDSIPNHAYGDKYRVYWLNPGGTPARVDHYVRYDNLPWDVALEIDTKYDDGVYNTGNHPRQRRLYGGGQSGGLFLSAAIIGPGMHMPEPHCDAKENPVAGALLG